MSRIDPRIERTRVKVLAAAQKLLNEGGPGAVTYSALAASSGVGRATIYRHWPTMEDLWPDLASDFGRRFQLEPTGEVATDLASAATTMVGLLQSADERSRLLAMLERSQWDESVRRLIGVVDTITPVRKAIDLAQSNGQLPAELDPSAAASLILGPLMQRAFMTNHPLDEAFVEFVVGSFIAAHL